MNVNTYTWLTFKQLPKPFQIKNLTARTFVVKDEDYGKVSYRVVRYNWCKKCSHHQGSNPKAKKCSCGSPYHYKYFITSCKWATKEGCNDRMCGVHPKSRAHSPVCVCDECM
jgi:hypothetical protein